MSSTELLERFIIAMLSDYDIRSWHLGLLTPRVQDIENALYALGLYLEIYGVKNPRTGEEPLKINLKSL